MKRPVQDQLLGLLAGAVATSPFAVGAALADPVIVIAARGGVEYSKNPFLVTSDKAEALRGTLTLSPSIENRTPRTSWRLSGDLTLSEYSRLYRSSADYRAAVTYRNALSTRLNLTAGAAYDSSIARNYQPGFLVIEPIGTVPPPALPDVSDITLVGLQDRRSTFSGNAGLSFTPDTRNSVALSYFGSTTTVPDIFPTRTARPTRYVTFGQNASYNRTINSRLSVGASVNVSRFDYGSTSLGDSVVISPNATASLRLSGSWSISGGLGVSLLRQNTIFGQQNTSNLSGNLSACRTAARESTCLTASRGVTPSSLGTARTSTALSATYSYRLTPRDDISFSGNYQRSGETVSTGLGSADYLGGSARYTRKLTERVGIYADAGFTRSRFQTTRSDARVGAGISYSWRNRP